MSNKFRDEAADYDLRLVGLSKSGLAWLVQDGRGTEAWLPLSQVDFPGDCRAGAVVTLTIPNWLAEEKGLDA